MSGATPARSDFEIVPVAGERRVVVAARFAAELRTLLERGDGLDG